MSSRAELRLRILECRACSLHARCNGPVPFRGPAPALYAVIGEAPGQVEDEMGKPFVGPAGQLLDKYLTKAGLDPADAFVCNTVSCFPHGTPKQKHIDACSPNLLNQLAFSEVRHALLLGAVALSVFAPGASIMRDHGQPLEVIEGVLMYPTYHPAFVLRSPAYTRAWREDLEEFARMVTDE